MRVAVCLSGQSRFTVKNFPSIRDNLIIPTGADVFFHHWDTENDALGMEPQKAVDLYEPKKHIIQPQKVWSEKEWDYIWTRLDPQLASKDKHQRKVQNDHSMLYSRMKANELKSQYEKEQGFYYDCVIRARSDLLFGKPFDLEEFKSDPGAIWTWFIRDRGNHGVACCDLFGFGNSGAMNVYSEFYLRYLRMAADKRHLFVEALFLDYLKGAGANLKFSKTLKSIHDPKQAEELKFIGTEGRVPDHPIILRA